MQYVSSDTRVYLVTPQALCDNGELNQLSQFSNLLTTCGYNLQVFSSINELPVSRKQDLLFYDASDDTNKLAISKEPRIGARRVLINVNEDEVDECKAIMSGLDGVFYNDDGLELIVKGLFRLGQNEIWFKREAINEAVRCLRSRALVDVAASDLHAADMQDKIPALTNREVTIIELVSQGAQNQEIADTLHISVNTVKTHIYSVFRKSQSRNRIELAAWAQRNSNLLVK